MGIVVSVSIPETASSHAKKSKNGELPTNRKDLNYVYLPAAKVFLDTFF